MEQNGLEYPLQQNYIIPETLYSCSFTESFVCSVQYILNIDNNTRCTACKVNDYLDNLMTQVFSKNYFSFAWAFVNTYSKNGGKTSLVLHRKTIWWTFLWLYIWWLWDIARNIKKEATIILLTICHFSYDVALDILLPPAQQAPVKTKNFLKGGSSTKQHPLIKATCLICHRVTSGQKGTTTK